MTLFRRLTYIAIAVAIATSFWWFNQPKPVEVTLHSVSLGLVESTIANTRTGTIKACLRSHIAPIVSGRVDQLLVKKGEHVTSGQLLLSLWNDDLIAQQRLAKSEAIATQAYAEEVCVVAELAQRDAKRIKQLQSKGLSSEESYDQAQNNATARAAACRAAQAAIDVAEAQRQVVDAALQRTQLKAPFDGIIAEINTELGEVLAPLSITGNAMGSAIDMIQPGCLYISAPIDEIDAPTIQPSMDVHITLDAFDKEQFSGKVLRIAPYILDLEKQARTIEVEVTFSDANVQKRMLPGYSTDVEIILTHQSDVLWLPTSALLRDNKVWIYNQGIIEKRIIKKGLSNWQVTEITQGLVAGEVVVLPSSDVELVDGMLVIEKAH